MVWVQHGQGVCVCGGGEERAVFPETMSMTGRETGVLGATRSEFSVSITFYSTLNLKMLVLLRPAMPCRCAGVDAFSLLA